MSDTVSLEVDRPAATAGETILIVDDNAAFRDMTEMALSSLGYTVTTCSSSEVALHAAATTPELQLLITDVVMTKMNGVELAAEIHRIRPEMKVLFCSGYPAATLARQGLDLTGGDFLMKPASLASLASKVAALMALPNADPDPRNLSL